MAAMFGMLDGCTVGWFDGSAEGCIVGCFVRMMAGVTVSTKVAKMVVQWAASLVLVQLEDWLSTPCYKSEDISLPAS